MCLVLKIVRTEHKQNPFTACIEWIARKLSTMGTWMNCCMYIWCADSPNRWMCACVHAHVARWIPLRSNKSFYRNLAEIQIPWMFIRSDFNFGSQSLCRSRSKQFGLNYSLDGKLLKKKINKTEQKETPRSFNW